MLTFVRSQRSKEKKKAIGDVQQKERKWEQNA